MIRKAIQAVRAAATRKIPFEIDGVQVPLEGLPYRKIVNWFLTETSVYVKPSRPWGLPTVLQVEPASHCNLRCPVCPVTTGLARPAGYMDYALYRRIIDELRDDLLVLLFWDGGEPLLHPRAFEMIRYARDAGIRVVCFTNGHLMAKPENARRVVESGLDQLVVAVDGITQETYEQFRAGGKLAAVLTGLRNVAEAKRQAGAASPLLNLRFIVLRHNEHEIPRLREFAMPLGVDVLSVRRFHALPKQGPFGVDAAETLVPLQRRYQLPPRTGPDGRAVRARRNPCRTLWNSPTIHWDGTICSCSMDFSEERPLGKMPGRSFREIWEGEEYRRLREGFRTGWRTLPLCGECASGYEGGDFGRDASADVVYFRYNNGRRES